MMDRFGKFLVARIFTAEVMGLILVVVAIKTLTFGISSSLNDANPQYFFWISLIAALISFGVSKSRLKLYQASFWIVALGVISIWIVGARLTDPLLDLGKAILTVIQGYIPQIIPAIKNHSAIEIDTHMISETWIKITETSSTLAVRCQAWLVSFSKNTGMNDVLVRTMVWTLIIWLFSAWMGWFAGKRNAVTSLLPGVLLLAVVISYSEYKTESLWLMIITLMLLMGVWNYKDHTLLWKTKGVDFSDSIRDDVTMAVILLTIGIGFIAFVTPSISWKTIRDYLRNGNKNDVAEMLGVQEHTSTGKPVNVQLPSLPRDHLLDAGYARSEKIVMTIRTGELPQISGPFITESVPHYYWRNVTYDQYVSSGWVTSEIIPQNYSANTPLIPGLLNGYRLVHLHVNMVQPEGRLFWSGILFSADIPMTPRWRVSPPSDLFANQSVLLQADMFAVPSAATDYHAEAYISTATVQDLRSASTDYPDAITKRYLKLPNSVPDRVLILAREITTGKTNSYDKAKAIESYLRTNYPYDLEIPAPPTGRDVADYFLFELKKGYCDYYATAMVVLARASGLPARFVSGYSSGSYDLSRAEYVVREMNAHSWVEVYFPEIGWIEFEPTSSQPEVVRKEKQSEFVTPTGQNNTNSIASQLLTRFRLERISVWALPAGLMLLGVIIYFTIIERWLYLRLAPVTAIERIYQRLYWLGRPLAGQHTHAETAFEFMQKLNNRIEEVKHNSHMKNIYITMQKDVRLLTNTYQTSMFRQYQTNSNDVKLALQTWKHLRLRLLVTRLRLYIKNHQTNEIVRQLDT